MYRNSWSSTLPLPLNSTLCRLLGIDGVDANTVPLPNVLVDEIKDKGVLSQGILFFLGNTIVETGMNPQQIAEKVAEGPAGYDHIARSPDGQDQGSLETLRGRKYQTYQ